MLMSGRNLENNRSVLALETSTIILTWVFKTAAPTVTPATTNGTRPTTKRTQNTGIENTKQITMKLSMETMAKALLISAKLMVKPAPTHTLPNLKLMLHLTTTPTNTPPSEIPMPMLVIPMDLQMPTQLN